jgi:hypothetical protein
VYLKLAANLSVPIMASEGLQRERKAPNRLQMVEEPKKPRRHPTKSSPSVSAFSASPASDEEQFEPKYP